MTVFDLCRFRSLICLVELSEFPAIVRYIIIWKQTKVRINMSTRESIFCFLFCTYIIGGNIQQYAKQKMIMSTCTLASASPWSMSGVAVRFDAFRMISKLFEAALGGKGSVDKSAKKKSKGVFSLPAHCIFNYFLPIIKYLSCVPSEHSYVSLGTFINSVKVSKLFKLIRQKVRVLLECKHI